MLMWLANGVHLMVLQWPMPKFVVYGMWMVCIGAGGGMGFTPPPFTCVENAQDLMGIQTCMPPPPPRQGDAHGSAEARSSAEACLS